MTGKIYWAKILGDPVLNYNKDGREWTFEFEPDEAGVEALKKHKLTDRLKDKQEGRPKYLVLKRAELNREGDKNKPIRIYDLEENEWDQEKLLGNGSVVDVKLDIRDYGVGKKKGIYPVAIRIRDHVEYTASEFGKYNEAPAKQTKVEEESQFKKDFGLPEDLDDDLPF